MEARQDTLKYKFFTHRTTIIDSRFASYLQIIQTPLKTPKSSSPVMDAVSCSSGGQSPANTNSANSLSQTSTNNSTSNTISSNNNNSIVTSNNASNTNVTNGRSSNSSSTLAVTPKMEHSPPEHYERQTVLMWGAASSNNNATTNRSPSTTPTSNGLYADSNHMKLSNQMVVSPSEQQHQSGHLKWNEQNNSKEIPVSGVPVYQIHQHQQQDSTATDTASIYAQVSHSPHLSHHSSSGGVAIVSPDHSGVHHSPQNHHQSVLQQSTPQHQTVGSSCEVWSPAYSQYQYFTYHNPPHAP